jgi:hypothetical protein
MATPIQPAARSAAAQETTREAASIRAAARVLRQKRDESEALIRLVEQAVPNHKGQNVDYYG